MLVFEKLDLSLGRFGLLEGGVGLRVLGPRLVHGWDNTKHEFAIPY